MGPGLPRPDVKHFQAAGVRCEQLGLDNNFEFYVAGGLRNDQQRPGHPHSCRHSDHTVQGIAGQVALTATAVTCRFQLSTPFAVTNLSVYSWMEGAAVATTTTAGGAAVVAGLSYAGGAVGAAAAGTGMVATAAAATTELGSGRSG